MLRAQGALAEHIRWAAANRWRHPEIDRIDRQLVAHWADSVFVAVHQDDPLAYGLDRLRAARTDVAARTGPDTDPVAQRRRPCRCRASIHRETTRPRTGPRSRDLPIGQTALLNGEA